MDKQGALSILKDIKENIHTCCAITMEPDQVLVLLDKLESAYLFCLWCLFSLFTKILLFRVK